MLLRYLMGILLLASVGAGAQGVRPIDAEPDSVTESSVMVRGQALHYKAIAGTLTVGSTNEVDALIGSDGRWLTNAGMKVPEDPETAPASARMFYVAYFRTGAPPKTPRPIVFLYNGGPSTASLWLHMGAFGPRRIALPDGEKMSGAPYPMMDNPDTLLDVADLVFIDAPGTGFSRVMGRDAQRAFWGVDQDAHAFERFVRRFLSKYDLWNNPKYLFGESYGTPRSAVLAGALQQVDLNGIILMSTILSFDDSIDAVKGNPGVDQGYALALPSYAAAAFYHHKLSPQPAELQPFLAEVEDFAMGDYMAALLKGARLTPAARQAMAERLHRYTSLPVELLLRYDLRVDVGVFCKQLLATDGLVAGRLDSRYTGIDPTPGAEENDPGLDPMGTATGAPYYALTQKYLSDELRFGTNEQYKYMLYDVPGFKWDWHHQGPGSPAALFAYTGTNMSLDLAYAMKKNPKMKVLVTGGYFDLGTPFYEGRFETEHLPIPPSLQGNISYRYYETGHMIYLNTNALHQLHEDVAGFIRETEVPR